MFYMNNYSRKSLIIIMMTFFDENTILINVSMTFIIHVDFIMLLLLSLQIAIAIPNIRMSSK